MATSDESKKSKSFEQVAEYISRGEELAYELRISEAMTGSPQTFTPENTMQEVLESFRTKHISGAPVLENGKLVGVISLEDLIRSLVAIDLNSPVEKYMSRSPVTIKENDLIVEGLKLFVSTNLGRLIVVDNNHDLRGIITKGDLTRGILRALQTDYKEEELKRYRASHLFEDLVSDRSSIILRYNILPRDFTHGGAASSNIKRALLRLGASPQIARKCAIATYEAEMNLIIHTNNGGYLRAEIQSHQIAIRAEDDGPGIKNVDLALQPGYTTASEEVRELGFGAGMGLINISRCVDWMKLQSTPGKGTILSMKIFLKEQEIVGEHQQSINKEPSQ
ncbi:MAG: CBS domain-containing protein [Chloroflexi bacterium]|nr:CBS domain-containing protein [Chloroflexota bacterium]